MDTLKYPIGMQSFERLRNDGSVYVDKTEYVWRMTHSGANTYFLSRPRRFGKSLLLSTIEAYFLGKKHLFDGLYLGEHETEWPTYPVIHIDMSDIQATDSKRLEEDLSLTLKKYADRYGVPYNAETGSLGKRFGSLMRDIHDKTGKDVVVLIDEYDKGIIEVLDNAEELEINQDLLRPFFAQIKSCNDILRFCLITGVARFRHYTIFSGFNNPKDISMDTDYAAICGITEEELLGYFTPGIESMAEAEGVAFDAMVGELRLKYDGYRFTRSNTLVYNPFSILNCFDEQSMDDFWIKSGNSKVFVKYLAKSDFDVTKIEYVRSDKEEMEGTFKADNPIPLLFQTGYLTIKDFKRGRYYLGIPNGEVRKALVDELVPQYMGTSLSNFRTRLDDIQDAVMDGEPETLLVNLQSLFASVPYQDIDVPRLEKYYHVMVYQIFLMLGIDARSEISMSGGRIDLLVKAQHYVYVMEFKLDGSPEEALAQIDSHAYALPWKADGRKVFKIGVNFSSVTRTLTSWAIDG